MTAITMAKALNVALRDALARDDRVLVFGEDVGPLGGVFRVTDGLAEEFGRRVFNTPLAEGAIAGVAVGLAIKGFRPVAEMQFDAFSYPAFEQVTSHLAKYHTRTLGACDMQVVIRIPYGGNIGAIEQHSESPETYYAHTAGLKVVTPATPGDAYARRYRIQIPSFSWSRRAATGAAKTSICRCRHCHLTARASPAPAPTPLSWRTGPPFTSPWPLPRQPLPRAPRSKSLTCGVSRRSIWRRWRPRCARPVVRWWCMRPLCSWVSAPRLPRGSCTTSSTYSPLRSSV